MAGKPFGDLIYSQERAAGEAMGKAETHTPKIEAPDTVRAGEPFQVRVRVGPHPSTAEHSIRWIEVYFYEEGRPFNPVHLARIELAPEYTEPDVTLTLRLRRSGVIYVLEYCSLHGVWEARKEVKVES